MQELRSQALSGAESGCCCRAVLVLLCAQPVRWPAAHLLLDVLGASLRPCLNSLALNPLPEPDSPCRATGIASVQYTQGKCSVNSINPFTSPCHQISSINQQVTCRGVGGVGWGGMGGGCWGAKVSCAFRYWSCWRGWCEKLV